MKRSEMILAGGLLVVFVGYLGGPLLLDVLTGSGKRLEARKAELVQEENKLDKLIVFQNKAWPVPRVTPRTGPRSNIVTGSGRWPSRSGNSRS